MALHVRSRVRSASAANTSRLANAASRPTFAGGLLGVVLVVGECAIGEQTNEERARAEVSLPNAKW
jgi:hypothetical protein